MLDVRKAEALYVIQIEHDSIGLSIFDGFDFTTVPDERFYDLASFLQQLSKIFEMDSQ